MAHKSVLQRDLFAPAKRIPKVRATEEQEQVAVVQWFDLMYPRLRSRLLHIPNGGWRHKAQAAALRKAGVRPGVPDLLLPVPSRGYAGLWVEMKRGDGDISDDQADWLRFLHRQGFCVAAAWTQEPAKALIAWYLEG